MESEKRFMFDSISEAVPLEQIQKENEQLIETASEQLPAIEPALADIINRIVEEKPDYVVFLDGGARIFGTPFKQYLSELEMDKQPAIEFYNDDEAKNIFIRNKPVDEIAKKVFSRYSGKKVFFIDETFSAGKGALTLREMINSENIDATYFALSQDDSALISHNEGADFYGIPRKKYEELMLDLCNDPRFVIYDNIEFEKLFSKTAANLYVTDRPGDAPGKTVTAPRFQSRPISDETATYDYSPRSGEIPHARNFMKLPDKMTWMQHDEELRRINFETVKKLKDMIYQTLLKVRGRK